jgi:tetratricopeptide (TPR) repeat protein
MYEESLLRWLDQLETKDIPSELALINDVLDVATELVTELEDRHEYLKPLIDDLRIKWSDQAMQMMTTSRYQHSLQLLNGMQHLDHARLGACHEKLKNNKDAAEHWLKANEYEKAINCYRQIPNLDQAIAIAQEHESPTLPTLRWLADVRQQFQDRGVEPSQQDLTEAEFKSLKGWADKARIPTPFPRDVEAEPSPLIPRKVLPMAPNFDDLEETI